MLFLWVFVYVDISVQNVQHESCPKCKVLPAILLPLPSILPYINLLASHQCIYTNVVSRTFAHLVRVWFHLIPVFCQMTTGCCNEGLMLDRRQNAVQPTGETKRGDGGNFIIPAPFGDK